ncbi:hypothetical protein OH773_11690 [Buttiauxella sp. WJP83]|uniref:hypothetical protein n=1 Tax=Buttiauxella sp. WJP83 TaxID=2986951 RepID=UPI0022DD8052|nr:hypothetical protein [Buttiauxella sp. WJP83]WBM68870.1 hypothetical protein OH773_11690 [Buttiauxella sp. WJP83]
MTSPSTTAGKACAECGIPDPCILDVISEFPDNKEKHSWSKEGGVKFDLLDEGEGCKGTITITSECDHSNNHRAFLEESASHSSKPLKADGSPNNETLYYKGENGSLNITDIFRTPWSYLSSITLPTDIFDEPAHYRVIVNNCHECSQYVAIDVYPTVEIRFTTGLSYEIAPNRRKRTIKERRDEQIKSRLAMENVKPKNNNQLRSGWQEQTAEFEFINNTMVNIKFGVKVCNTDFSHEYKEEIDKLRRVNTLEHLNRVDRMVDRIKSYFAPDPENENSTREYSVFSSEIKPVQLGLSCAYQHIDIKKGPCHYFGLYGDPFLEATFKFDIIQFICAYCKIDSLVAKCRSYLEKHKVSLDCYIEISTGVSVDLGAAYNKHQDEWTFGVLDKNKLYLGIKGVVSVAFEAEVFVVQLTAKAEGTLGGEAGFALDPHDNGLDLVLYHDGIKGTFEFIADVRYSLDDGDDKRSIPKTENKVKKEWQLCDPLKASDSSLRVNLYGKERPVNKPAVTPPDPINLSTMEIESDPDNGDWNNTGYDDNSY